MKKGALCFIIAAVFIFSGCGVKLQENSDGFYDKKNDIQYIPCAYFAVKSITIGDEYATNGDFIYYTIKWQKSTEFICDADDCVYRASSIEEITVKNFNPVAVDVYVEGTDSRYLASFYCSPDLLPDELKKNGQQDDSALVYSIRDSMINDQRVTVAENDILEEDMYHLRLLSADYPGLYYDLLFFTDKNGEEYLMDRGTGEYVLARDDLVTRMIG